MGVPKQAFTVSSRKKPTPATTRRLRQHVLELLKKQGLAVGADRLVQDQSYDKEQIRRIHAHGRSERLSEEHPFVEAWLPKLWKYLASGSDIDPSCIDPHAVVVGNNEELAALFRVASLWWSVPVSRGFGRRFRIVVFDRSNGKLIGLIGLTDPVFNLRARDSWIGWASKDREKRLAHVMDAYVLGAVPPYNVLLGAKLLGLLATSDFVRNIFRRRYRTKKSVIRGKRFDGRLAMVTVTSALGRSSVYNRLRFGGSTVFQSVGFTQGYGHFHLANGTYANLRAYLKAIGDDEVERFRFGQGPNYRIRVVRTALEHLGLPRDLLRHGVKRAVYVAPMASNTAAFLKGEAKRLRWHRRPVEKVVKFWRERWLEPRASWDKSYREFDRQEWNQILESSASGPSATTSHRNSVSIREQPNASQNLESDMP